MGRRRNCAPLILRGSCGLCRLLAKTGWIGRDWGLRTPNYLSDDSPRRLLNEAEAWLIDMVAYRINLSKIVGIGYAPDLDICDDIRAFVSATARQRVIAMLQIVKPELFH